MSERLSPSGPLVDAGFSVTSDPARFVRSAGEARSELPRKRNAFLSSTLSSLFPRDVAHRAIIGRAFTSRRTLLVPAFKSSPGFRPERGCVPLFLSPRLSPPRRAVFLFVTVHPRRRGTRGYSAATRSPLGASFSGGGPADPAPPRSGRSIANAISVREATTSVKPFNSFKYRRLDWRCS